MAVPTPKELVEAGGISLSYANKILLDGEHRRTPPRSLAILIFRKTGWRHSSITELTEDQMQVFEQVDPWTPPKERQDEAA
jgi:hypothetical protein